MCGIQDELACFEIFRYFSQCIFYCKRDQSGVVAYNNAYWSDKSKVIFGICCNAIGCVKVMSYEIFVLS